jgi:hypothetical protein
LKKENIILLPLKNKVTLLGQDIYEVYCDLKHIQYGWDSVRRDYNQGPPRNNYTEEDVMIFFEQLNYLTFIPVPQRTYLKSVKYRFIPI